MYLLYNQLGLNDLRNGKGEFISIEGWKYKGDW